MSYRQWAEVADRVHRPDSRAVVLLLVEDFEASGWSLRGYDRSGRETMETWHFSSVAARDWAASEYSAEAIGSWRDIPDEAPDPVGYVLRWRR